MEPRSWGGATEESSLVQFLGLVREVAADAAAEADPDVCLRHVRSSLQRLGFHRVGTWITDPENPRTMWGTWGTDWDGREVDEHSLSREIGQFIASERIVAGERYVLRHLDRVDTDPRSFHQARVSGDGPLNNACVALRADGQLHGIISVDMLPSDATIDPPHVAALELVADQVAVAIARGRAVAALRSANQALLDDLGDRRQTEAALRDSEERQRSLFDGVPIGLYRTMPDGQVLDVNPALVAMLGLPDAESFRATNASDLFVDQVDRVHEMELLERDGIVRNFEMQLRRYDGAIIWVEDTVHIVRDVDGATRFYEGSLQDITERKHLEEQLRQAQKMEAIGQLAGGVAHDFNNLLTVISGYGELLRIQLTPETSPYDAVEQILVAAESAASLTRQLLAFSRRQVIAPREIDLDVVVEQLGKMLRRVIGEDVSFITVLTSNLGLVKADPGQIEQILMNLASNARDAMPHGGKLTLETANVTLDNRFVQEHPDVRPGRYVMLQISDTGSGMDDVTLSRVFEPFFTTKEVGKGTGMGLAAVYGIVKQHNGAITVESELGRGTTLRVYFPRIDRPPVPQRPSDEPITLPRGHETILFVEDERQLRALARMILEASGYTVLEAAGGEMALRAAERSETAIQLLVTDVVMPGLSGRELAEQLTARHPGLKVLFVSGYTDDVVVRHGIVEAAVDFLQKPFSPAELMRKVREVLDRVV